MACSINLFTQLQGTPDTGGSWTYSGASSMAGVSIDGGVDTTLNNGNSVGTGNAVTIDVSNTPSGSYDFTYGVGSSPCEASSIVTVTVVDGAIAGVDNSFSFCDSDATAYNLMDILAGGDGTGAATGNVDQTGTWSGDTGNPAYSAGGSPSASTFTPANSVAGSYTFTYTVDNSVAGTPAGCDNCLDAATITIQVTEQADAGNSNTVTLCNAPV